MSTHAAEPDAPEVILGGAATNGAAPKAGVLHAVTSPATGVIAGSVRWNTAEEVAASAAELKTAQRAWQDMGPRRRAAAVSSFVDWIQANSDRIEELICAESGRSLTDAKLEIPFITTVNHYYGMRAHSFLKTKRQRSASLITTTKPGKVAYEPYPLVGIISPWNFPVALSFIDAVPALIAGAAVLIKPSEVTPLAVNEIVRGWTEEVGLPDVLRVVNGDSEAGAALVDAVDFVQFTGSGRTGSAVMERAAKTLTPVSLELGGKDAMIVLEDADIERAANGAVWGAMVNSGQMCVSVERVYVADSIHDEFVAKVAEKVGELSQGEGGKGREFNFGALADKRQLAIVERHVNEAVEAGAKVVTGGKRRDSESTFYEPTVLVDVDHSMSCMREETFGPTMPIMRVKSQEEAIELANDSEYGLSGSVWSKDFKRATEVAAQVQSGSVLVNDLVVNLAVTTLPQGGLKNSGIGSRFGGPAGIRKYCRQVALVESRLYGKFEPTWYSAPRWVSSATDLVISAYGKAGRVWIKARGR